MDSGGFLLAIGSVLPVNRNGDIAASEKLSYAALDVIAKSVRQWTNGPVYFRINTYLALPVEQPASCEILAGETLVAIIPRTRMRFTQEVRAWARSAT